MGKVEKFFLGIVFTAMVLLLLLSSTDWIIKEQDEKVHQISVIVDDSKDEYWTNYKKGMEKAATKWNSEINFITISYKGDLLNQMELIEEELNSQTDALIISPVDSEIIKRYLNELPVSIPVIAIGANISSEATSCYVGADYYSIGQELGSHIIKDNQDKPIHVIAVWQGDRRTDTAELYQGLKEELNNEDIEVSKAYCKDKIYMESYIRSKRREDVKEIIVFLDVYSLNVTVELFDDPSETVFKDLDLYSVGYNDKILYYLDKGVIKGVFASSAYNMGYLSVEKAEEMIKNSWNQRNIMLEYKFLRPEDVYNKENELLLFPRS